MRKTLVFLMVILIILFTTSCNPNEKMKDVVFVMLEKSEYFTSDSNIKTTEKGGSVAFNISFIDGYTYKSNNKNAKYENGTITIENVKVDTTLIVECMKKEDENYVEVKDGVLHAKEKQGFVFCGFKDENGNRVSYANNLIDFKNDYLPIFEKTDENTFVYYHKNGGEIINSNDEYIVCPFKDGIYLYPNSLGYEFFEYFYKEGCVLKEYNTKPDGSGIRVGVGSKILIDSNFINLYPIWEAEDKEFLYDVVDGFAELTEYKGSDDIVCIPKTIDGYKVTKIRTNCFKNKNLLELITNENIIEIEKTAFNNCLNLTTFYLYDSIHIVQDKAFLNTNRLEKIRVIANMKPVYSDDLINTVSRRIEVMHKLLKEEKPTLFFYGGSGMYHNIDGDTLKDEFNKEYNIINLGQNANVSGAFMLDIYSNFMKENDVLLLAPEYYENLYSKKLNITSWISIESNYDVLENIDIREYSGIFDAFTYYQMSDVTFNFEGRLTMKAKSYTDYNNELNEYFLRNYEAKSIEDNHFSKGTVDFNYLKINSKNFEDIYIKKIKNKGIIMLYSFPAIYEKAYTNDESDFLDFENYLKENISFPVISNALRHFYEYEYIFDSTAHLTSEAAKINSIQYANSIKSVIQNCK